MIAVLGSVNLDLIVKAERLPSIGETVSGSEFLMAPGGKGANQALAARRAGSSVRLAGAVGSDDFAAIATRLLKEGGVDLRGVQARSVSTGVGMILVDKRGENMIMVVPGANGTVSPVDAERLVADLDVDDVLLIQLEIPLPTVAAALSSCAKKGVRAVLNIAPYTPDAAALAQLASVVIANETEMSGLVGRAVAGSGPDLDDALSTLHAATGASYIVTLGGEGAVGIERGTLARARALPISPVDTVGAGDAFCGYFASGLERRITFQAALARAAIAGSLACMAHGAQTSIPLFSEVDRHSWQDSPAPHRT